VVLALYFSDKNRPSQLSSGISGLVNTIRWGVHNDFYKDVELKLGEEVAKRKKSEDQLKSYRQRCEDLETSVEEAQESVRQTQANYRNLEKKFETYMAGVKEDVSRHKKMASDADTLVKQERERRNRVEKEMEDLKEQRDADIARTLAEMRAQKDRAEQFEKKLKEQEKLAHPANDGEKGPKTHIQAFFLHETDLKIAENIWYLDDYFSAASSPEEHTTHLPSKKILALKNSDPAVVAEYTKRLFRYLPNSKFTVAVVPSSKKGGNSSGIGMVAKNIVLMTNGRVTDGTECLLRTFDVQSNHLSTRRRSMAEELESIRFKNTAAVSGKTVLLIDDIATRGITLQASKKLLMDAGATNVVMFAFSKTAYSKEQKSANSVSERGQKNKSVSQRYTGSYHAENTSDSEPYKYLHDGQMRKAY